MGFTYLNKFSYLNTFVMEVAQRCSDNGGRTVSCKWNILFINGFLDKCPSIWVLLGSIGRLGHEVTAERSSMNFLPFWSIFLPLIWDRRSKQRLVQWNIDYPNTNYTNGWISECQIDCSIRVFCQLLYDLLE